MIEDVTTWVVTADGRRAQAFEERRRFGPLHPVEAMTLRLEEEDHPRASHPGGTVHDRGGPGRHNAHEANPSAEAERRFLTRLAAQLERAAQEHKFEALVLIAPPKALGVLRETLGPAARRLVRHDEARDRVGETAEELRLRLRELRTPA